MFSYTRAGLAIVERELKKAIDNLSVPVRGECSVHEMAARTTYALAEVENALWELHRTFALDENLEAMTPASDAEIAQAMKDAAQ